MQFGVWGPEGMQFGVWGPEGMQFGVWSPEGMQFGASWCMRNEKSSRGEEPAHETNPTSCHPIFRRIITFIYVFIKWRLDDDDDACQVWNILAKVAIMCLQIIIF